jgi:predicted nucleic acid-binding protein
MPKPRVYVETTIPSAYHTNRTDPKMVQWRTVTRQWWAFTSHSCELVTSLAVLREVARGRSELVPRRLELLGDLALLRSDDEIDRTAALYVLHKLMPRDLRGDALHLALASHHECDVLATWNYHHLANPGKLGRIRRLNEELGLTVPRILTPQDLMEEGR